MREPEDEKQVDLGRHRQYDKISLKYIRRVFLVITTLGVMIYFVFDFLQAREALERTQEQQQTPTDSTQNTSSQEVEIQIESK